jgi:sigma-B regulation protein RsbU (phosphoserine phosphatase)
MSARTSQASLSAGHKQAGSEVATSLTADDAKVLLLFPDGLACDGTAIIQGAEEILGEKVVICGAAAGDNARFVQTYQVCDGELLSGAMPAMMLYSEGALEVGTGVMSGWRPIGVPKTVTEAEGNVVHRIGDETALNLYSRFLGEEASQLPAIDSEFPLGLIRDLEETEESSESSDDEYLLLRSPVSVDHEKGSVTFAAEVPEGAKVHLTMARTHDVVKGARAAAEKTRSSLSGAPDAVLFFSSVARQMVLGGHTSLEIEAAQSVFGAEVPMAGFYGYGEIGTSASAAQRCLFHNQTATFLALREPSESKESRHAGATCFEAAAEDDRTTGSGVLEAALAGAERQSEILERFCFALEQDYHRANSELQAANERMKRDLLAAARAQHALLPKAVPESEESRFAWQYDPCDELAGDALNIHRLDDRYISLYVVDVMGHGVPAALLSVTATRALTPSLDPSSIVAKSGDEGRRKIVDPAEVIGRLNSLYPMASNDDRYFTMIYGVLDTVSGLFRFSAGGHPGPIVVRRGAPPEQMEIAALPVGMFENAGYEDFEIQLATGDRLYLVSDGFLEETNDADEEFEVGRLMESLAGSKEEPLKKSLEAARDALKAWHGNDDFNDDLSIVGLEWTGE